MAEKREQGKEPDSKYWSDMVSSKIVSSTDCTGSVPTPPLTDDDVEGYSDLFHVTQQKAVPAQKSDTPAEQESKSQP